jgi:hypothetical protein
MLLSPLVKTEQPRCDDLQVHEPVSSRAFTEVAVVRLQGRPPRRYARPATEALLVRSTKRPSRLSFLTPLRDW